MSPFRYRLPRRRFLQAVSAGLGGSLFAVSNSARAAEPVVELTAEHEKAVNRRRRMVVQFDSQGSYDLDFDAWLDYRFAYIDEPGSQIDSVFWDMGRLGQVLYPSKFLDRLETAELKKWRDQGIDMVGRLIEGTRKRGLEVFWHHRFSEVDVNTSVGRGAAWKEGPAPLKRAHPDWALENDWWHHGLWNCAVPGVRECTVKCLREVAEMYDLDGVQIDFAGTFLLAAGPAMGNAGSCDGTDADDSADDAGGGAWPQAAHACVGQGASEAGRLPRGRPGCGDLVQENLVDMFTLGSRSMDVDVGAYRRITEGRNIKLHPCFDDHHATDGYRYPPMEVLRGVASNWWQQGADGIMTFNWSNAPPEVCQKLGQHPGPPTHQQAYRELGDPKAMAMKDKTFVVERRGGYPWAQGFFGRNDTSPLPMKIVRGGDEATVQVRVSDDLKGRADRVKGILLRVVLFNARDEEDVEAKLNGAALKVLTRDAEWKDPQIFSPKPQPASGGKGDYRVNPRQKLLRVDFAVEPGSCVVGKNEVGLRVGSSEAGGEVQLEKVEVYVRYEGSG